ncbi:hypothetical protein M758_10G100700 [Ceratodon purpureus]|nr:hypothetical protein M758_10G100700 [Ceratodon purpureus]
MLASPRFRLCLFLAPLLVLLRDRIHPGPTLLSQLRFRDREDNRARDARRTTLSSQFRQQFAAVFGVCCRRLRLSCEARLRTISLRERGRGKEEGERERGRGGEAERRREGDTEGGVFDCWNFAVVAGRMSSWGFLAFSCVGEEGEEA